MPFHISKLCVCVDYEFITVPLDLGGAPTVVSEPVDQMLHPCERPPLSPQDHGDDHHSDSDGSEIAPAPKRLRHHETRDEPAQAQVVVAADKGEAEAPAVLAFRVVSAILAVRRSSPHTRTEEGGNSVSTIWLLHSMIVLNVHRAGLWLMRPPKR